MVDDDNDIRQGASLRLKAQGYEPILASDGEEAIASAIANRPDAIVMDVRMPRGDGFSALVRLKENERTRRIPVIMLSASIGDRQASLDAGARFFLDKPYQGKTLVAAVETAIAESNSNHRSEPA
jgi:DNA-binding response OmpR family regulator